MSNRVERLTVKVRDGKLAQYTLLGMTDFQRYPSIIIVKEISNKR